MIGEHRELCHIRAEESRARIAANSSHMGDADTGVVKALGNGALNERWDQCDVARIGATRRVDRNMDVQQRPSRVFGPELWVQVRG